MRLTRAASFLLLGIALFAPAQGQQYTDSTFAGGIPLPTPTLSADTTIGYPGALASDGAGNVYIPDPSNNAIRILRPINGPF